jgi:hypothetical protein
MSATMSDTNNEIYRQVRARVWVLVERRAGEPAGGHVQRLVWARVCGQVRWLVEWQVRDTVRDAVENRSEPR